LHETLKEVQHNDSDILHPRAALEHCDSGLAVTIYRSGRAEWGKGRGMIWFGPDAGRPHIKNVSPEQAVELWQCLLREQFEAINGMPWQVGFETDCHVCGFDLGFQPWGAAGNHPTYFICPCCACEFGMHDLSKGQATAIRQQWIKDGCPWLGSPDKRPPAWDPRQQLKKVPTDFLGTR
jgi:hypothetical protein